jgi:hypothetical protein
MLDDRYISLHGPLQLFPQCLPPLVPLEQTGRVVIYDLVFFPSLSSALSNIITMTFLIRRYFRHSISKLAVRRSSQSMGHGVDHRLMLIIVKESPYANGGVLSLIQPCSTCTGHPPTETPVISWNALAGVPGLILLWLPTQD